MRRTPGAWVFIRAHEALEDAREALALARQTHVKTPDADRDLERALVTLSQAEEEMDALRRAWPREAAAALKGIER